MYLPPHHRMDDAADQRALIAARPFGLLVTSGPGGLIANPAPFLLDEKTGPHGVLRAHLARANPQWREADGVREALVVFQDVDAYITPSWYETKRETGKVVPTWNYSAVHVYGKLRAIEDRDWLRKLVGDLTDAREAERKAPWKVSDAPDDYIDAMLRGIVGVEIEIARIEGKAKVSQNRTDADRKGVVAGLRAEGGVAALRMAHQVEQAKT
ncbi:MAG: FMN-binding negative transcriptional regulator [Hyphomicrobiales bacterium]|nr:FMN-binding negative transcriptional regulator [Hyphomicrobiales bacterium]